MRIVITYLVWMFLKLIRKNEVIIYFFYLDVLKIKIKKRENYLNR